MKKSLQERFSFTDYGDITEAYTDHTYMDTDHAYMDTAIENKLEPIFSCTWTSNTYTHMETGLYCGDTNMYDWHCPYNLNKIWLHHYYNPLPISN